MSKIKIIAIGFGICYLVLVLALFKMQIIDYKHYHELSEKNRVRPIILEAPRGLILDRNGEVIASNRLSFDCYILPKNLDSLDEVFGDLSFVLGIPESKLKQNYKTNIWSRFRPVLIARDISKEDAVRVEEKYDSLPGVFIKTGPVREYQLGEAAAHITGYVGSIDQAEYSKMREFGYRRQDKLGRDGVESTYNSYLRGLHGAQQFEVDHRGKFLRVLSIQEQQRGESIELTIDAELQKLAYRLLDNRAGSIVLMELQKGGVLALANSPSYDPNEFVKPKRNSKIIKSILNDPDHKLLNRAVAGEYPPGSTFKIVTALASLKSGHLSKNTEYFCPGIFSLGGFSFKCWHSEGHGSQNISQALEHSCNVYFYNAGLNIGVSAITDMAHKMGLGQLTHIDLPQERKGLVPSPSWKSRLLKQSWYAGETVNLSIGQGYLLTTPLQMARVIAMVASGGELFEPFVVNRIGDIDVWPKKIERITLSQEDLKIVKDGLIKVVESKTGTGQRAKNSIVRIAGKTGTAQASRGNDHAWFVGYAPYSNPQAAIAVVLENGGKGGVKAAPIARDIFEYMQTHGYFI